jgi:hypothetical protein
MLRALSGSETGARESSYEIWRREKRPIIEGERRGAYLAYVVDDLPYRSRAKVYFLASGRENVGDPPHLSSTLCLVRSSIHRFIMLELLYIYRCAFAPALYKTHL